MRFVAVLAVVLLLVGCAQASSSVEKQKREGLEPVEKEVPQNERSPYIPAYHITKEQECTDTGIVGKCYSVSTDAATSEEDLEIITSDIVLKNREYLAILVSFYPNTPAADVSGMGFAFKNEQVARVVLAQYLAPGSTVEDEVGEAMANGGIYVVSVADEVREFTEGTTW